jgi:hypothetical protein
MGFVKDSCESKYEKNQVEHYVKNIYEIIKMKQELTFGIITPSYTPDFERCKLLNYSIKKFVTTPVNHYIVVDDRDYDLFYQLQSETTQILTKEALLPWWIKRIPIQKNVWFSLKTLPVRGWLIQQIIKIASALYIAENVSVFVDSDVLFVRPFQLENLVRYGKIRLYRGCEGNDVQKQWHLKWHQSAAKLLGLSEIDPTIPDYITQIISWRKDCVLQLCQQLEKISGRSWIETLCNSWNLSEYVLYGIFVDNVLKGARHYYNDKNICHNYWLAESLSKLELEDFIKNIDPEQVAVMISAKAGMSVESYYPVLEKEFAL